MWCHSFYLYVVSTVAGSGHTDTHTVVGGMTAVPFGALCPRMSVPRGPATRLRGTDNVPSAYADSPGG